MAQSLRRRARARSAPRPWGPSTPGTALRSLHGCRSCANAMAPVATAARRAQWSRGRPHGRPGRAGGRACCFPGLDCRKTADPDPRGGEHPHRGFGRLAVDESQSEPGEARHTPAFDRKGKSPESTARRLLLVRSASAAQRPLALAWPGKRQPAKWWLMPTELHIIHSQVDDQGLANV
jgi:hypothetical protein